MKSSECKHADEINENFEYCNELADRINILGDAVLALESKFQMLLEKFNEAV